MLYGYTDVEGFGASTTPFRARRYEDVDAAKAEFEVEAREFFRIESRPLLMTLFIGEPDGDEEVFGYPDYPDYVFKAQCNDFNSQDVLITEEAQQPKNLDDFMFFYDSEEE